MLGKRSGRRKIAFSVGGEERGVRKARWTQLVK